MTNLKQYNCLTIDYGSYISVAERLGREDGFGKSYYAMPYVYNGYPDHKSEDIGKNVPNVIKVREWAEIINDVDLIVFPDAHEPALQEFFVGLGKKVYGSRYASELEHDRVLLKKKMEELGLPVNDYWVSVGVDELEELLKSKENLWIKSRLRGDLETFKHTNWILSKGELQRMRTNLGASQNNAIYVSEEDIDSLAEIGADLECIDGMYPTENLNGIELKDTGYYGQILPYDLLPKQLKNVSDKLSNTFRELSYRGAYSNEVIIDKKLKGYLLDNTCRCPQPPTDLKMEMYTNYPEVIWFVANGIVPKIEYKYKHGVQFILKSDLAKTDASPIIIPDQYKNFVKIKNWTIDEDGVSYYVPLGIEMSEAASCVGMGNTMREAINMATKIANSLQGFDIKINTDCIDKVKEQIGRLKAIGIHYLE